MHIAHLSLTNFRNYGRLELDVPPGVTLLHGANAQGKTNLLEAIHYLATTRSPYADSDQQIINWDANQPGEPIVVARLVAQLATAEQSRQIELRLIKEVKRTGVSFRREALVDRRKVRLLDLLGNLRAVLFIPSDVEIIAGSPAVRRRYLDIALCQTDTHYCRTLSAYNKVLEQRNAALRQIAETGRGREVVSILTEKLIQHGSIIFAKRSEFMGSLARAAQRIHYEFLTGGRETIRLRYLPRLAPIRSGRQNEQEIELLFEHGDWLAGQADIGLIAERFNQVVESTYDRDVARGTTTIGPHRDDWRFWVDGRSLGSYGSRGQQRSAVLALKMAEIEHVRALTGEYPILLLDEVVAELDESRRELLLQYVQSGAQAVLTATDPGMFTNEFLRQATTMIVSSGRVSVDTMPQDI